MGFADRPRGAGDLRCARHGDRMAVAGTAFGDHQVVIVAAARQMRCFNTAAIGTTAPDPLRIADNASRLRRNTPPGKWRPVS